MMCVLCPLLPLQLRSHVDILKKAVKDEQAQRTSLEVCSQPPYQCLPPLSCRTDRQTCRLSGGRKPVLGGKLFSDHILFLCSFPMDYLKEASSLGDPPLSPLNVTFLTHRRVWGRGRCHWGSTFKRTNHWSLETSRCVEVSVWVWVWGVWMQMCEKGEWNEVARLLICLYRDEPGRLL